MACLPWHPGWTTPSPCHPDCPPIAFLLLEKIGKMLGLSRSHLWSVSKKFDECLSPMRESSAQSSPEDPLPGQESAAKKHYFFYIIVLTFVGWFQVLKRNTDSKKNSKDEVWVKETPSFFLSILKFIIVKKKKFKLWVQKYFTILYKRCLFAFIKD